MMDAQFVISIQDKFLEGAELLNLRGETESDCAFECMLNDRCQSINFCHWTNTCHLNSGTAGDAKANLVNRKGCEYKSTNYSSMKVCN